MALVSFVTLRKSRATIIKQPSFVLKRNKEGKVVSKRQIQYCPQLDTIYVDEQRKIEDNPRTEAIVIEKGILKVDDELDPRKVEFLKNCEQYGKDFKILDIESDSLYQLEEFEKVDTASLAVKNASDNMVRALAMEFINPATANTKLPSQLKVQLIGLIRHNAMLDDRVSFAEAVNSFIDDKSNKEKLLVSVAITEEIISTNGKQIIWTDSGESIYNAPQANDAIKSFALWLKNDTEGRAVLSALTEKLKKKD